MAKDFVEKAAERVGFFLCVGAGSFGSLLGGLPYGEDEEEANELMLGCLAGAALGIGGLYDCRKSI